MRPPHTQWDIWPPNDKIAPHCLHTLHMWRRVVSSVFWRCRLFTQRRTCHSKAYDHETTRASRGVNCDEEARGRRSNPIALPQTNLISRRLDGRAVVTDEFSAANTKNPGLSKQTKTASPPRIFRAATHAFSLWWVFFCRFVSSWIIKCGVKTEDKTRTDYIWIRSRCAVVTGWWIFHQAASFHLLQRFLHAPSINLCDGRSFW